MNFNYLATIFRSILTQIYVFLVLFTICHFDLEMFISKNCKYIFFYLKFVHLGENTSKYCSRIIVVHVHATVFFLKYTQRVTIRSILQTGSNPVTVPCFFRVFFDFIFLFIYRYNRLIIIDNHFKTIGVSGYRFNDS